MGRPGGPRPGVLDSSNGLRPHTTQEDLANPNFQAYQDRERERMGSMSLEDAVGIGRKERERLRGRIGSGAERTGSRVNMGQPAPPP